MTFQHQTPEPYRGILLKAGTKNMIGMGGGFKKRFVVVDEKGLLKYYDKDPALATDASKVVAKGEIDLARRRRGLMRRRRRSPDSRSCLLPNDPTPRTIRVAVAASTQDPSRRDALPRRRKIPRTIRGAAASDPSRGTNCVAAASR